MLCVPSGLAEDEGFQDPNGNYPLSEGPNANTDTNSLARGEGGVPVETRLNNLDGMLAATQTFFTVLFLSANRHQDTPHNIRSTMSSSPRVVTLKSLTILRQRECTATTAQEP